MSSLELSTPLTTQEVMARAREGVFWNWSRFMGGSQKSAERRGQWSALPAADGGVFDELSATPTWSARFDLPDPKGRGGARVDVRVFDQGSERHVLIDCAGSLAYGVLAKNMAKGIAAAIQT